MLSMSHAELTSEVERLRSLLADTSATLPLDWRLRPTEETVFRILLARDFASPSIIAELTTIATPQGARTHVHRIRQKLKPRGVEIETLLGKGWRLIGRDQWRAILAANTQEGVK